MKHRKVEKVPDKQQQAEKPPPQGSDKELFNAPKPSPSPASNRGDALPAAQVLSSPTLLRRVSFPLNQGPEEGRAALRGGHSQGFEERRAASRAAGAVWTSSQSDGPISGSEKVHLLGEGFSDGQDLLVLFGDRTMPVSAKLFNPYTLECMLPPSDSARCVLVTLHWQDGPEIRNQENIHFTYEDINNDLSVSVVHSIYSCMVLTAYRPGLFFSPTRSVISV